MTKWNYNLMSYMSYNCDLWDESDKIWEKKWEKTIFQNIFDFLCLLLSHNNDLPNHAFFMWSELGFHTEEISMVCSDSTSQKSNIRNLNMNSFISYCISILLQSVNNSLVWDYFYLSSRILGKTSETKSILK